MTLQWTEDEKYYSAKLLLFLPNSKPCADSHPKTLQWLRTCEHAGNVIAFLFVVKFEIRKPGATDDL